MGEYNGRRQGKNSGQQNNLRKKRERDLPHLADEGPRKPRIRHKLSLAQNYTTNHNITARILPHSVHISLGK